MLRSHRFCLCVLCAVVASALAVAMLMLAPETSSAQPPTAAASPTVVAQAPKGPISFINQVAPIFKENCFSCHDAKKRKGKLDMTTIEAMLKGGENESDDSHILVNGKPDESDVYKRIVTTTARRMPPKDAGDPLPKDKMAIVEQWIKEGAKVDVDPKADLLRELRIRWKPPAPQVAYKFPVMIHSLAFTPDNAKLVVGGHHELTVWDVATGKLEKRIATRAERAKAMLFLPDGKLVVAGSRPGQEGDVRFYDINGGQPKVENDVAFVDGVNDPKVMLAQLVDTDDEVLCLALSPDGKRLAAGGCDRLVRVWDISEGVDKAKLEQTSENHADWVLGVVFAPDGKHMLTCSRDKTAKVWDLVAKESVLTFPDHQQSVYGVVVSPDSKVGFSVGEDGQLRRFNATGDGKGLGATAAHAKGALKIVMHPKQPIIATCGVDNTAKIWNTAGQATKTLTGHTDHVFSVAISPDATKVASGSYNGEVKIWNVADGKVLTAFNGSPGYTPPVPPKQ
ncbi:MAG: hypothetical protein K2R98_12100 [Gemmataceae bacterium]|nr:hypothetical protein [Gemmataceae bacterium]